MTNASKALHLTLCVNNDDVDNNGHNTQQNNGESYSYCAL